MVSIRVEDLTLRYPIRRQLKLAPRDKRLKQVPSAVGGIIGANRSSDYVDALNGVSFALEAGDRLGLVGSNGAGKSTLLKVLYGIFPPTSGTVAIEGRVDALFNIRLGFRRFATGRRNIVLRGLINGWSKAEIEARMDDIIAFSELGSFIDLPMKAYSAGMGARLAFAMATSFQPEVLLMDEWIGAGDRTFRAKAKERMDALAANAGIIVLASHNMSLLERTCNKILVLEKGRVKAFVASQAFFRDEAAGEDEDGPTDDADE